MLGKTILDVYACLFSIAWSDPSVLYSVAGLALGTKIDRQQEDEVRWNIIIRPMDKRG